MPWARKPLPANVAEQDHTLVGLDLNATRARAVHGPAAVMPRGLTLDGTHDELPMVLSLQGRHPEVGRAGAGICRQSPHLVCSGFLAHLGEAREWAAGRHRLDSTQALSLVLGRVYSACDGVKGLVLAVPTYLSRPQVTLLASLAEKARLPLLGVVKAPLAVAWASYLAEPWSGQALVLDVDDHALTLARVVGDGDQLWMQETLAWSHLNRKAWKEQLLDKVADRCVRQSRRDPRDCAPAEQSLYEQLDDALEACKRGKTVELLIQTSHWYQNLLLRHEELITFCERLVRQVLEGIRAMYTETTAREGPTLLFVSRSAGRLPGLVAALQNLLPPPVAAAERELSDDFGEALLPQNLGAACVTELASDAVARSAHDLAVRMHRGSLPRGHLDASIPLPSANAPSAAARQSKRSLRILSADS
jgi:hypothetical protein